MAAFLDILSSVQKYAPLAHGSLRYIFGEVIFNNDPLQVGRIKVKIPDLLPFDDKDMLPWVFPTYDPGIRGPLPDNFKVPTFGCFVLCFFPYNSIYHGFYIW